MGRCGPPPKPTALRVLEGTGHVPINQHEPKPEERIGFRKLTALAAEVIQELTLPAKARTTCWIAWPT